MSETREAMKRSMKRLDTAAAYLEGSVKTGDIKTLALGVLELVNLFRDLTQTEIDRRLPFEEDGD